MSITARIACSLFLVIAMTAPQYIYAVVVGSGSPEITAHQDALVAQGLTQDQAALTQQSAQTSAKAKAAAASAKSYQFKNEGIFGCNANVGESVGAMAAVGGVYVPVNDAAVTINTGILIYKMCILDPLTRKIAENATAGIGKGTILKLNQGRGGEKMFVQKLSSELKTVAGDAAELASVTQIKNMASLGPNRNKIVQILVKNYTEGTDGTKSLQNLACPYGDMTSFETNQNYTGTSFLSDFRNSTDRRCYPIGLKDLLEAYALDNVSLKQADQATQWDWGRGFYPVQNINGDQFTTVTPAAYVEENGLQAIQSGFRQAENVNSIGEMTTALFAGLSQQILSDSRGLAGINQSTGNQPSYLNQLTAETGAGVKQSANNTALTVLAHASSVEAQYLSIMNAIAAVTTTTISQLRNAERQCCVLLIPEVKAFAATQTCTTSGGTGGPSAGAFGAGNASAPTQTCTGGFQIQPATSTAFSQAVINAQIVPLAQDIINDINLSTQAVQRIDQLIAGVTTVTSLDAQNLAKAQLDTLLTQHLLHKQSDLIPAAQRLASVKENMSTLVTNTVQAWADSTDPTIGWCNYKNPATLAYWANLWKKP